MRRHSKFCY